MGLVDAQHDIEDGAYAHHLDILSETVPRPEVRLDSDAAVRTLSQVRDLCRICAGCALAEQVGDLVDAIVIDAESGCEPLGGGYGLGSLQFELDEARHNTLGTAGCVVTLVAAG